MTIPVAANLPQVQDNLDVLADSAIFSSVDIMSAYYITKLHKDHRDYTSFHCPGKGAFRFCRASMGLKSSQAWFINLTIKMFKDLLYNFVVAYSDDVLVYSKSIDEHIDVHLRAVFERFRRAKVKLKATKVFLCTKSLEYCGQIISTQGIMADPKKLLLLQALPYPRL